nr:hypothetical protein [Tanacetum cinerariifolium]
RKEIPEVIPFIECKEWIETKNELYKMMEAYTKRMNQQHEQEALLAAQREQELREQEQAAQREQELLAYKQAAQEKEEPSQNSDFHQFIREMCGIKASVEQKQKLEEMMLELLDLYTLIDSSPKFDYLLEEFFGKLTHIDPIPLRIEEADFGLEEEICLVENLSYDNSSPRPLKEFNVEITDRILESLSVSPIPIEDSDSHIEDIDLFLATDNLMPPGIKNDRYDLEGDIHFLKEWLRNDPFLLPENESSNFDHHEASLIPRPPPKPPDVEVLILSPIRVF